MGLGQYRFFHLFYWNFGFFSSVGPVTIAFGRYIYFIEILIRNEIFMEFWFLLFFAIGASGGRREGIDFFSIIFIIDDKPRRN